MLQAYTRYAGVAQTLLGLLGAAAPGVAPALGAGTGGSVFNILSGGALSYLGFKGTAAQQRTGALGIGTVNAVVGVLGVLGVREIGGIPLNPGTISMIVNLAIGAWGIIAGLMKK
jgi:hypothetical protein